MSAAMVLVLLVSVMMCPLTPLSTLLMCASRSSVDWARMACSVAGSRVGGAKSTGVGLWCPWEANLSNCSGNGRGGEG